jgi:hypothetical protein
MSKKQLNIFIIPGNPPAKYFYELWSKELMTHFPSCKIGYSSFPSFDSLHGESMDVQANDYIDKLKCFYQVEIGKFCGTEEVIILGHSFGAYIANLLINKSELNIQHCYNIFPFMGSPNFIGKLTLTMVATLGYSSLVKNFLLKNKNLLFLFQDDILRVDESELRAGIDLGIHENYLLKNKRSLDVFMSPLKNTLVYSTKDTWCNHKTVNILRKSHTAYNTRAKHDFVLDSENRNLVTDLLVRLIKSL